MLNCTTHDFHTDGFTLANIQTKHRCNKSVICESPRSRARCGEARGKRQRLTACVGGWVDGAESGSVAREVFSFFQKNVFAVEDK